MNLIKNFIRNIVHDVVDDHHNNLFTTYHVYDMETGNYLHEDCELAHKPCVGDVIDHDAYPAKGRSFKMVVQRVHLCSTGFTGKLYGTKIE